MNAEEARRALEIAQRHDSQSNHAAALRFARKAVSLSDGTLVEATVLVARLEKLPSDSSPSSTADRQPTASTSSSNPNPASTSKPTPRASASRPTENGNSKPREYTKAQVELVMRVKKCKITEYYEILGVEKTCNDAAIKKAYRKLALGLHPDKCGAPGAEEAFKMVSKAFQVLGDDQKRAIYDQTGGDPDSRGGGGGSGFSPSFARGAGGMGGSPFANGDEISPEELFNMFFGGGGFGGGFGGGPGFTTSFYGPGGMRFTSMNGGPRRANGGGGAAGGQQRNASMWIQLLPLLVLFGFSLLTQLPALFTKAPIPDPDFSFSRTPRYTLPRTTTSMGVDYFVNPQQFSSHPIYKATLDANPSLLHFTSSHDPGSSGHNNDLFQHILTTAAATDGKTEKKIVVPRELSAFERTVESSWVHRLRTLCQHEIQDRQDKLDRARGFLGIGADWDKVREITNAKLEHCERLSKLGYHVQY